MTKQEFLAFSLPYGLHCQVSFRKEILELDLIKTDNTFGFKGSRYFKNCKPILHPLSDLTKEIEHGGENFVPITILKEMNDGDYIYISEFGVSIDNGYAAGYNLNIAFTFIQKLIEWHFDIAGLIEKGEAINVNTLSENPYK